jgi:hypothetical protein
MYLSPSDSENLRDIFIHRNLFNASFLINPYDRKKAKLAQSKT